MEPFIVTKQMANVKRSVAKLQLAFWCNWLWKALRVCDMSSLLFIEIDMARPKVA